MNPTIESKFHFLTGRAGRRVMQSDPKPEPTPPPTRIPRVSRLMALAIHFDEVIQKGIIRDYADLARLGGVSRARITQVMNLLNLPPWRQEEILFLDGAKRGRDGLTEREMRKESALSIWPTKPSQQIEASPDWGRSSPIFPADPAFTPCEPHDNRRTSDTIL